MSDNADKGDQIRFMLRLPSELDRKLKRDAQHNSRSKNKHIVHLLTSGTKDQTTFSGAVGSDMEEQAALKWFRGLDPTQRRAFLELTHSRLNDSEQSSNRDK